MVLTVTDLSASGELLDWQERRGELQREKQRVDVSSTPQYA